MNNNGVICVLMGLMNTFILIILIRRSYIRYYWPHNKLSHVVFEFEIFSKFVSKIEVLIGPSNLYS